MYVFAAIYLIAFLAIVINVCRLIGCVTKRIDCFVPGLFKSGDGLQDLTGAHENAVDMHRTAHDQGMQMHNIAHDQATHMQDMAHMDVINNINNFGM